MEPEGLVDEARRQTPVIVVDVHAEATSEKVALSAGSTGASPPSSERTRTCRPPTPASSAGGTAAITDVGMTGPHDSVIGVKGEQAIYRMRTGLPVRFETAEGGVRIEGALIERPVRPRYGDRGNRIPFPSRTTSRATSTRSRASTSSDGRGRAFAWSQ